MPTATANNPLHPIQLLTKEPTSRMSRMEAQSDSAPLSGGYHARLFGVVLSASLALGVYGVKFEQSPVGQRYEVRQDPYSAAGAHEQTQKERFSINELGEAGYRVQRPIPVEIEKVTHDDFLASFSEANIAISGTDTDDAYQALVAEILDTFDVLVAEKNLGKSATAQLKTLRTYIVKT